MDLEAVCGELANAVKTITGLRVADFGVQRIHAPAAVIGLPERIDYDYTGYNRGADRFPDLPVIVLVANPTQPAARRAIAAYAADSGPKSVKAKIEAFTYTTCDSVRVAWAEVDDAKYAGTDYLAAVFHLDIVGKAE